MTLRQVPLLEFYCLKIHHGAPTAEQEELGLQTTGLTSSLSKTFHLHF